MDGAAVGCSVGLCDGYAVGLLSITYPGEHEGDSVGGAAVRILVG
jgi:hypothetical protein